MKKLLLVGFSVFSGHCLAWTAAAVGDLTGKVYIETGFLSEAQATLSVKKTCEVKNKTCTVISSFTGNRVLVVARSPKGVSVSHREKLQDAEEEAVKTCTALYKDCTVEQIAWDGRGRIVVVARAPDFSHVAIHQDMDAATNEALFQCKLMSKSPEKCETEPLRNGEYFSTAGPVDKNRGSYSVFMSSSKKQSDEEAVALCEKTYKTKCALVEQYSMQSAALTKEPQEVIQRKKSL